MLAHILLLAQIAAFPGAAGGGAASVGGRGGQIIEVTNLNDSGGGSLRDCINASGPRTCIFRTGGQITNRSRLQVNNPFLTIAGQTAPGGGITLGGANMSGEALFINTHDVIIRYLTCNGYNPNTPTGPDTGTVCFETTSGSHDNIWDHISVRWWGNKGFITYSNDTGPCCDKAVKNLTLQNSLVYEPNTTHPVGPGTDAAAWPNESVNQDFHHILFANIGHRIPMVATSAIRLVSSITFNWNYFAVGLGGSSMDLINNKWVAGNMNGGNSNPHPVNVWSGQGGNCTSGPACDLPGTASIYMKGNIGPQGTDYQLTAQEAGTDAEGTAEIGSPIPSGWQRSTPLAAEPFPITADPPSALDAMAPTWGNSRGLDCSGNWIGHQDSQDARIIAQYQSGGSGNTFSGQFQQPAIAAGTPCQEDVDHLPIAYKQAKSLPVGTNVANQIAANGYTVFENYLNSSSSTVVPPPPPPPPSGVSSNGTTIPPAVSIVDAKNATWTLGAVVPISSDSDCAPKSCGSVVVQNSTPLTGTAATLLLYFNSTVYQENASAQWWSWNGGGWTKAAGDPRGVTPPPPTITAVSVSCVPPSITFPATSQCSATVSGSGSFSNNVTWSANAPNGLYTSVNGTLTATVTATSVADPTKTGSTTITINQPVGPPTQPTFTITVNIGGSSFTLTCAPVNGVYACH